MKPWFQPEHPVLLGIIAHTCDWIAQEVKAGQRMKGLRLSSGYTVNLMLAWAVGDFINKTKEEKQRNKQRKQVWVQ